MAAIINYNFIDVKKPATDNPWSVEASTALAQRIADKVRRGDVNIRIIQPQDSLGPIVQGLNGGVPVDYKKIVVIYLGRGHESKLQKMTQRGGINHLIEGSRIHPGQHVYFNGCSVYIAATMADLEPARPRPYPL